MAMNQENENGVIILAVDGNLDAEGTQAMEEKVLALLESGETKLLLTSRG